MSYIITWYLQLINSRPEHSPRDLAQAKAKLKTIRNNKRARDDRKKLKKAGVFGSEMMSGSEQSDLVSPKSSHADDENSDDPGHSDDETQGGGPQGGASGGASGGADTSHDEHRPAEDKDPGPSASQARAGGGAGGAARTAAVVNADLFGSPTSDSHSSNESPTSLYTNPRGEGVLTAHVRDEEVLDDDIRTIPETQLPSTQPDVAVTVEVRLVTMSRTCHIKLICVIALALCIVFFRYLQAKVGPRFTQSGIEPDASSQLRCSLMSWTQS